MPADPFRGPFPGTRYAGNTRAFVCREQRNRSQERR
jgi:hypothetical protein